jgi:hypothetical protein
MTGVAPPIKSTNATGAMRFHIQSRLAAARKTSIALLTTPAGLFLPQRMNAIHLKSSTSADYPVKSTKHL